MKRVTLLSAALLVVILSAAASAGGSKSQAGFDKLKALVGEWEGKNEDGSPGTASYQLIAGGTALMETLTPEGEPGMVTIYTVDGDRVALTHYCTANNQPRMQTEPITGDLNVLDFSFTGGTNLPGADTAHINGLVVTFQDKDHFIQKWSWKEAGNVQFNTIHLTRKK